MNSITTPAGAEEGDFPRPGVHEHPWSADHVFVVTGEHGERVVRSRTCPHGTHDLLRVGLVNVTTGELMCSHAPDRWSLTA